MDLIEVLRPEIMDLNLNTKNKKETIEKLADLLLNDGAISSKETYIEDVFFRETQGETGLGNYIAIPHGKSDAVQKTSVAVGKLINPIEWETLDGNPVKLIFLFAVPKENKDNEHLKLLAQLASVLAYENSQEELLNATSSEQVLKIFSTKNHCLEK